jgi:hypothetical protein
MDVRCQNCNSYYFVDEHQERSRWGWFCSSTCQIEWQQKHGEVQEDGNGYILTGIQEEKKETN